ncbi:MAG: alpha/beta hydrolase family protein [Planctomycetota bacterium]
MTRSPYPLLVFLCLAVTACRQIPAATTPRPPPGPDVPTPAYYAAAGPVPAPLRVEVIARHRHHEVRRLWLPPRVPEDLADVPLADEPIEVLHLRVVPAGRAKRPLVIGFPILANGRQLLCEFGSGFVRMGYDVAFVLRKELAFDPRRSVEQAEEELRLQVMRGRQVVDWFVQQPTVDPERLAGFGISAGGILGVSLAAADPRLKAHVFIFAGGPMADVLVDTVEDRFADRVAAVQRERGWSRERIRDALRRTIRTDPITLAARVPRESVLLFLAAQDTSVPTARQVELWEALGRPEARVLPLGHYTSFLLLPYMWDQTQRFLGARLRTP